jgi:hypothetical protein
MESSAFWLNNSFPLGELFFDLIDENVRENFNEIEVFLAPDCRWNMIPFLGKLIPNESLLSLLSEDLCLRLKKYLTPFSTSWKPMIEYFLHI